MSLPHRVGGALVVLGQDNGEQERVPAHVLAPPNYGPGNHEYFTAYPFTAPSNVITKVCGTLGATAAPGIDYTPATLPRNFLNIVCYKTALNHWFPKLAWDRAGVYDAYNSDCINDPTSPYFGDEPAYATAYSNALNADIYGSYVSETTVTDIIEDPSMTPANLRTLFPRWSGESPWDMGVKPYEDAIQVSVPMGGLYWQTREGPTTDNPVDFIAPWYVTYDTDVNDLRSLTRIFCDFSYKFTDGTYDPNNPVASMLVYPYSNRDVNLGLYYQHIPDTCSWQYSSGYPSGGYRTTSIQVFPDNGSGAEPMRWESEATHGLFLDANGSCWNIGTVLEVKVYIWKAPPKICFYPKTTTWNGVTNQWAYTNWQVGGFASGSPFATPEYWTQSYGSAFFPGRGYGSPGNRHGPGDPGLEYFETGISSGIAYSIPSPNPMAIFFWGVCFAPDYDSPLCQQHEVLTFTVTLDETNTYECDGTPRPEAPSPTQFGYKLEDIVIPKVEGFITYIQDYEVTAITDPADA